MNAIQLLSAQPWVDASRLDAAPLPLAGRPDRRRVCRGARDGSRDVRPERSLRARLRGARRHGRGPAGDLVPCWARRRPASPLPPRQRPFPRLHPAQSAVCRPLFPAASPPRRAAPFLSWVVAVWLAGATALLAAADSAAGFCAVRLRSRLVRPAPAEWQQTLDRLKARIRVSRPVRLLVSSLVQAPAVVGWLRPVVLVPVGALAGLPRRTDRSASASRTGAHPPPRLSGQHAAERRRGPAVLPSRGLVGIRPHPRRARAVLRRRGGIGQRRRPHVRPRPGRSWNRSCPPMVAAMAANGGSLAHRIARLLGQPRPAPRTLSGPGIVAAAMLPGITAFAVFGQPAARPKFEVASIKPSGSSAS